jgi:indole-3-glycerol phosphate synthase
MILDDMVKRTEKRVALLPSEFSEYASRRQANLTAAIRNRRGGNGVIAEIKCTSPSRWIIRRNIDMPAMAGVLVNGGCVALSILTEPYFFGGTGQDIAWVKTAVDVPVLRKDFIIDERQIEETRAFGAYAILLIAAALKDRLPSFVERVRDFDLEPLVEVHSAGEIESALATETELVGINNCNLTTMTIDRSLTRTLSGKVRETGRLIVSESGMRSADDIREMKSYCDTFLIGSSIMAHDQPRKILEEFVCA